MLLHKHIIREAARVTRNENFIKDADSVPNKAATLVLIARLVWDGTNKLSLALEMSKTLLKRSPFAARFFHIHNGRSASIDEKV